MKDLNQFIVTCESLLINDIANEGYNMDIAKMIKDADVQKARNLYKEANKLYRSKNYTEALNKYKEGIALIYAMKTKVDNMPEPKSRSEKILSWFTPIFTLMPQEEATGAVYTGNGTIVTYTSYSDSMSRGTSNSVKRSLQERFNLFIKRSEDRIEKCNYKIKTSESNN
jgi:hypothetical protein